MSLRNIGKLNLLVFSRNESHIVNKLGKLGSCYSLIREEGTAVGLKEPLLLAEADILCIPLVSSNVCEGRFAGYLVFGFEKSCDNRAGFRSRYRLVGLECAVGVSCHIRLMLTECGLVCRKNKTRNIHRVVLVKLGRLHT